MLYITFKHSVLEHLTFPVKTKETGWLSFSLISGLLINLFSFFYLLLLNRNVLANSLWTFLLLKKILPFPFKVQERKTKINTLITLLGVHTGETHSFRQQREITFIFLKKCKPKKTKQKNTQNDSQQGLKLYSNQSLFLLIFWVTGQNHQKNKCYIWTYAVFMLMYRIP